MKYGKWIIALLVVPTLLVAFQNCSGSEESDENTQSTQLPSNFDPFYEIAFVETGRGYITDVTRDPHSCAGYIGGKRTLTNEDYIRYSSIGITWFAGYPSRELGGTYVYSPDLLDDFSGQMKLFNTFTGYEYFVTTDSQCVTTVSSLKNLVRTEPAVAGGDTNFKGHRDVIIECTNVRKNAQNSGRRIIDLQVIFSCVEETNVADGDL